MKPSISTGSDVYHPVSVLLHWVLAVAIVALFGLGLYMADLPFSLQRLQLYNWHKWAGVTVLLLSAMRLLWRLSHRPPPEAPGPAFAKRGFLDHTRQTPSRTPNTRS